jgi:hypothetical protein
MKALADSLSAVRGQIGRVEADPALAAAAIVSLEEIGGQIGRLQVGCCTEKRMPLYARMLEDLADAQLAISRAVGTGH